MSSPPAREAQPSAGGGGGRSPGWSLDLLAGLGRGGGRRVGEEGHIAHAEQADGAAVHNGGDTVRHDRRRRLVALEPTGDAYLHRRLALDRDYVPPLPCPPRAPREGSAPAGRRWPAPAAGNP